jgi:thiol-disulfide isomerase/thioredoxin
MNKNIGIILGVIVIIGIGFFAFSGNKTETNEAVNSVPEVQNEASTNEIQTEEQGATQEAVTVSAGSYEAYSADKLAMAEIGDVVLFFHASWCPSCRALNSDIEKNLGTIPEGVTILKTDYDKETELKKKYGVTYQHTLVQVDKDGNQIKKWSGSSKLENLISQIQ